MAMRLRKRILPLTSYFSNSGLFNDKIPRIVSRSTPVAPLVIFVTAAGSAVSLGTSGGYQLISRPRPPLRDSP